VPHARRTKTLAALAALRKDVDAIVRREGGRRGERIARAVAERFAAAEFPFLSDRLIPRIAVQGSAGEITLETGLRRPQPWPEAEKRELIARGLRAARRRARKQQAGRVATHSVSHLVATGRHCHPRQPARTRSSQDQVAAVTGCGR